MSLDALHQPPLMPHLLVEGLNRYNDEPCLFLGDKVATYREVGSKPASWCRRCSQKVLVRAAG